MIDDFACWAVIGGGFAVVSWLGFDGGFFRLFVLILFSFGWGLVGCFGFGCCVVTSWVLVWWCGLGACV